MTDAEIKDVVDAIDFSAMVTADDFIYVIARAIEQASRRAAPAQPVEQTRVLDDGQRIAAKWATEGEEEEKS